MDSKKQILFRAFLKSHYITLNNATYHVKYDIKIKTSNISEINISRGMYNIVDIEGIFDTWLVNDGKIK